MIIVDHPWIQNTKKALDISLGENVNARTQTIFYDEQTREKGTSGIVRSFHFFMHNNFLLFQVKETADMFILILEQSHKQYIVIVLNNYNIIFYK